LFKRQTRSQRRARTCGEATTISASFRAGIRAQEAFVAKAATMAKPQGDALQQLLAPISEEMTKIDGRSWHNYLCIVPRRHPRTGQRCSRCGEGSDHGRAKPQGDALQQLLAPIVRRR
jgi:hypothetical protein